MNSYFSKWTLSLKEKEISNAFQKKTHDKYNKLNPFILIILELLSLSLFIVLLCFSRRYLTSEESQYDYYVNYAICSLISITNLIFLAIIVKCPNMILQRAIIHYISACVFILYMVLRYIMQFSKLNALVSFSLTVLEFCYRFLFIVIGLMNFVDLLITCGIMLVLHTMLLVGSFHLLADNLVNSYFYYIFLLITVILSYFFHRKDLISFCYEFKLNESCEWHKKMLNASNAGVMKIEREKVSYLNKKAEELILKNKIVTNIASESTFNTDEEDRVDITKLLNQNLNLFLNDLIENCSEITNNDEYNMIILRPLDFLKERYIKENKKDFLYLCHKTFYSKTKDEMVVIEILYCYLVEKGNSDNFEFIFNDVTNTKKKTEFQYKSMFFSKIAHEFKTPLITIRELTEKISESTSISEQRENIELIKALSLYMYSLSKDLECFSQLQIDTNDNIFISSVDLEETVQFVKTISSGLLTRYQKKDRIKVNAVISNKLPNCIQTDEVKLSQILINLISNSIKFTNEGSITLKFDLEDNCIRISVTDTGIGMAEEIQHKLFTPFEKMIENNPTGVGLGLCIVKELTSKLGTMIEFSSKPNKGSSFYFKIPLIASEGFNQTKDTSIHQNTSVSKENTSMLTNNSNNKTIEMPQISLKLSDTLQKRINVLIADDEPIIRQASIRVLKRFAAKNKLYIDIVESTDGFELLYKVTANYNTVNSFDIIICDENMTYCNGLDCFLQLNKLVKEKKIHPIDFFILSANISTNYNLNNHSNFKVTQHLKPLTEEKVKLMLENAVSNNE